MKTRGAAQPRRILAVDIGGTKLKVLASGETEPRKAKSGPKLTPEKMVDEVKALAKGWRYDAVSVGLPAQVGPNGPVGEPGNLGPGWVGFDYAAAFDCPVRLVNDAAMQALGSYEGGRMLFIGLGTGVGSALIVDHVLIPLELGARMMKRRLELMAPQAGEMAANKARAMPGGLMLAVGALLAGFFLVRRRA